MAAVSRAVAVSRSLSRRLGFSPIRPFGASAVAQLEYDSDDDFEFDRRRDAVGVPDSCAEERRSVQWVFMGSPGARRHVYANRIAMLLGVPYISMGSLVRKELNPLSSLYSQIANAVNEGNLVPEDIIFALLSQRLEEGYAKGERGFILDGIPRTRVQAEILDQIADIDLVVNFKCMEEGSIRSSCNPSDQTDIFEFSTPKPFAPIGTRPSHIEVPSRFVGEEAGQRKLQLYVEQNKLLEEYYRKQRKLLDFHLSGGPRETWRGLLAALHLLHIDPINSSPKLTV